MTPQEKALAIPDELAALNPNEVTELARIWWGENSAHMNVRPALKDPRHMGAVLAECAWNFSNAYAAVSGLDRDAAFAAICHGWDHAHARAAQGRGPNRP